MTFGLVVMGKLKKGLQLSVGNMICGVGKYQKFDEDDDHSEVASAAAAAGSTSVADSTRGSRGIGTGRPAASPKKAAVSYNCEECGHQGLLKVGPQTFFLYKLSCYRASCSTATRMINDLMNVSLLLRNSTMHSFGYSLPF